MSTITLPNIRVSSDLTMRLKLKDGGVAIDCSELSNIKARLYSDAQSSISGRCDVSIDEEDSTVLVCTYAANKPQYLGANRIIVQCAYMGETKTYDKPVLNFVRWTDDQEGEEITIDDPDIDVEIEVQDVTSSILQEAIDAALSAAEKAEEAAALVPLQVLQDCVEATEDANEAAEAANAAGITSVEASVADNEPGTPSVEATLLNKILTLVFHHLKGVKGDTGTTPNITVGTVTTGEPGTAVVVTMTGTAENPVLNITIPQGLKGDQGNTGSSVDYPFELVNNCTTNDATKALAASQGKALKDELSQLDLEVHTLSGKYYGLFTSSAVLPSEITQAGYAFVGSSAPFAIWNFDGTSWSDTGATVDAIHGEDGVGFASVSSQQDGTIVITLTNGDTVTIDLNHNHPQYLKYQMLQSESAMPATPESDVLYMWPEE